LLDLLESWLTTAISDRVQSNDASLNERSRGTRIKQFERDSRKKEIGTHVIVLVTVITVVGPDGSWRASRGAALALRRRETNSTKDENTAKLDMASTLLKGLEKLT